MLYTIKNGYVYIKHEGKLFLDEVFYRLYPEHKNIPLIRS